MDSIAELSDSLENLKLQSVKQNEEKQETSILLERGPTGGIPTVASGYINNSTHGIAGGSWPTQLQFAVQDKTGNRRHLEEFEEQPVKYMKPDESQVGSLLPGTQQHSQSTLKNMMQGTSSFASGNPVYQQHLLPLGNTLNFPVNQFAIVNSNVQGTSQPNQSFSPVPSNINYEKPKRAAGVLVEETTLDSLNLYFPQILADKSYDIVDNLLDSIEKEKASENAGEVERNLQKNTKRQSGYNEYGTNSSAGSPSDQRVPSPGSSSITVPVSISTENFFNNSPMRKQHGPTNNINSVGIQLNPSVNKTSPSSLDYPHLVSDNGVDELEETLEILEDLETGSMKDLIRMPVNQERNERYMSTTDQNNIKMPSMSTASDMVPPSGGNQPPMLMFSSTNSNHILCESSAGCQNNVVHPSSVPLPVTQSKPTVMSTFSIPLLASVFSETSQTGLLDLTGSCFQAQQVPSNLFASQKNCFAVDPNIRPQTCYNIQQSVLQPHIPSQMYSQPTTGFTSSYGLDQYNGGASSSHPGSVYSQSFQTSYRQQLPQNGTQAFMQQTSAISTLSSGTVPAFSSACVTNPDLTPVSNKQMTPGLILNSATANAPYMALQISANCTQVGGTQMQPGPNKIPNRVTANAPYILLQNSANYNQVISTQVTPCPTTVPNSVSANASYILLQNAANMGELPNMKINRLPPGESDLTSAVTVATANTSASKLCTKFAPIAPKPVTTSGTCSANLRNGSSSTKNTKILNGSCNRRKRQAAKRSALVADSNQQHLTNAIDWVANLSSDELQRIDAEGNTCLHIAIYKEQEYVVYALLKRISREGLRKLIDHENSKGRTPLYVATFLNQQRTVGILIKCGADPNIFAEVLSSEGTIERNAAIHVAASRGLEYHKTLEELLKSQHINLNINSTYGQTALHCAVWFHGKPSKSGDGKLDSTDIVRTLIKAGANPCAQEHSSGQTPLMFAIKQKKVDMVETILKAVKPETVQAVLKTQDFSMTSCLKMAELLSGSSGAEVWNKLNEMFQKAIAGQLY